MWVRQGRTDAWIAHKLDVSVDELARFKREHDLDADEEGTRARPADPLSVPAPEPPSADDFDDFAEEEEEEEDESQPTPQRERERPRRRSRSRSRRPRPAAVDDEEGEDELLEPAADAEKDEDEMLEPSADADRGDRGYDRGEREDGRDEADDTQGDGAARRRRRRGRRGGRRHRPRRDAYEATFDHGEEGYGLWLDPAVVENPLYSEHWAGHRAVTVTVEAETITIRRADASRGPEEAS